ncbi:hypothetical protein HaLaN_10024 [Haematococcus lacustris]|uniref:Protein kinase domain-containing protein n=1 Tax=Haematococcus lacustris TaxID=44745 RepID=A0A699Z4S6_HAELA|nr:hypothetical protein HaLaN_10024 [Haematococcus lacustris]
MAGVTTWTSSSDSARHDRATSCTSRPVQSVRISSVVGHKDTRGQQAGDARPLIATTARQRLKRLTQSILPISVCLQLHNAEQYRMSFFSKLFRGKSAGPEQLGPNKFCRTATTIVDLDDSDDSDDSVRPLSAPVPGAFRRAACDMARHGRSNLRRSQSARVSGAHSGLVSPPQESRTTQLLSGGAALPPVRARLMTHSTEQSRMSSCVTVASELTRWLKAGHCHDENVTRCPLCCRRKATIYEGIDRCSKRPVIVKAFSKQGMTQVKHEKMLRESSMLKVASEVPGVVRLLNVVEDTQSEYHILEYVPALWRAVVEGLCFWLCEGDVCGKERCDTERNAWHRHGHMAQTENAQSLQLVKVLDRAQTGRAGQGHVPAVWAVPLLGRVRGHSKT